MSLARIGGKKAYFRTVEGWKDGFDFKVSKIEWM